MALASVEDMPNAQFAAIESAVFGIDLNEQVDAKDGVTSA